MLIKFPLSGCPPSSFQLSRFWSHYVGVWDLREWKQLVKQITAPVLSTKPESSLPHSHKTSTESNPKPADPSHYHCGLFLMPILTRPWHLRLCLVPFSLPYKALYQFSIIHIRETCPTSLFLLNLAMLIIGKGIHVISDVKADKNRNLSPHYA